MMQTTKKLSNECINVIGILQHEMDFENLIRFFVAEGFTQELFDLISSSKLEEVTQTNVILIAF